MTVADLIAELQRFPGHTPVVVIADFYAPGSINGHAVEGHDILNIERSATSLGYGVAIVARD